MSDDPARPYQPRATLIALLSWTPYMLARWVHKAAPTLVPGSTITVESVTMEPEAPSFVLVIDGQPFDVTVTPRPATAPLPQKCQRCQAVYSPDCDFCACRNHGNCGERGRSDDITDCICPNPPSEPQP